MTATSNRKPSPAQAEFIRAIDSFGTTEVPARNLFRPYGICDVESRTLRIVQEEGWVRLETRCGRCGLTVKRCRAVNPDGHQSESRSS